MVYLIVIHNRTGRFAQNCLQKYKRKHLLLSMNYKPKISLMGLTKSLKVAEGAANFQAEF